uniref:Alkylglycerol monooxygenase n=1 Tax=Plectus sambesii TaxID=2011161 RepID=A0A914WWK3_9BILA
MDNRTFIDVIFSNTSLGHRILDNLSFLNLRYVFYIVSPYESTYARYEDVPNYNVEVGTWFLVLFLLEFAILWIQGIRDRHELNDTITSMSAVILSQIFKFGGRTIAIYGYLLIWNNFRVLELPWDSPWTWLLTLLTQDFLYYVGHRAVHEAGFLWALHAIHHSSEYYNLSTALRQAAIQDVGLMWFDMLQAFFIPPQIFLVHRYFNEVFQFWLHTSLVGSLGPFGEVFNTPSYHRVHHGRNPYCIDKNYGAVFIIWDKMFGTFERERGDDPPIYGLVTNVKSFNQLWLQFSVFKEILYDKVWMKDEEGKDVFPGIRNKIKAALYPPGYFPGKKTKFFFHWYCLEDPKDGVPEVEMPVHKYNPQIPLWIKLYCIGHFLMLLSIYFHFEHDRFSLSYVDFTLQVAFIVYTMQCFGAFFDNVPYASYLELSRCALVFGYHCYLTTDVYGPRPSRIFALTIWMLSSLLWAGYIAQLFVSKIQDDNATKVHPKKQTIKAAEEGQAKSEPIETVSARVAEAELFDRQVNAQVAGASDRETGVQDSAVSVRL